MVDRSSHILFLNTSRNFVFHFAIQFAPFNGPNDETQNSRVYEVLYPASFQEASNTSRGISAAQNTCTESVDGLKISFEVLSPISVYWNLSSTFYHRHHNQGCMMAYLRHDCLKQEHMPFFFCLVIPKGGWSSSPTLSPAE